MDGDTNQELGDVSCAHPESYDDKLDASQQGSPTWWSVDLAAGDVSKKFIIENVTIYFRRCCEGNLQSLCKAFVCRRFWQIFHKVFSLVSFGYSIQHMKSFEL